jgi:hypothetical protein
VKTPPRILDLYRDGPIDQVSFLVERPFSKCHWTFESAGDAPKLLRFSCELWRDDWEVRNRELGPDYVFRAALFAWPANGDAVQTGGLCFCSSSLASFPTKLAFGGLPVDLGACHIRWNSILARCVCNWGHNTGRRRLLCVPVEWPESFLIGTAGGHG